MLPNDCHYDRHDLDPGEHNKVTLYSLPHTRVQISWPAVTHAVAKVLGCKLNTRNAPSKA